MLRITEEQADGITCLRLEGRAIGPWVGELDRLCGLAHGAGRSLRLEMAGVSFLDPEAVRLVKVLMSDGVPVLGCSAFVRAQLEGESDDASSFR